MSLNRVIESNFFQIIFFIIICILNFYLYAPLYKNLDNSTINIKPDLSFLKNQDKIIDFILAIAILSFAIAIVVAINYFIQSINQNALDLYLNLNTLEYLYLAYLRLSEKTSLFITEMKTYYYYKMVNLNEIYKNNSLKNAIYILKNKIQNKPTKMLLKDIFWILFLPLLFIFVVGMVLNFIVKTIKSILQKIKAYFNEIKDLSTDDTSSRPVPKINPDTE